MSPPESSDAGQKQLPETLSQAVQRALEQLADYQPADPATATPTPLRSLLGRSEAFSQSSPDPEPIRSVHHFACTGGSLISKCLSALPNVVLLSEIDPLSTAGLTSPGQKPAFAPHDLIRPLLDSPRQIASDTIVAVFQAAMEKANARLAREGFYLVLRDHAHSHFCTQVDVTSRPTTLNMLRTVAPVYSVVSVRHPLDSYLSLAERGWQHFSPKTLDEYSKRYLQFLDHYKDSPIIGYEQFVADPPAELARLCDLLRLPYHALSMELFSSMSVTGDSGRTGADIAPRPRRRVPAEVARQCDGESFTTLCERLAYRE